MSNYNQAKIRSILPGHIVRDHPHFVLILEKYYEWLEKEENAGGIVKQWDHLKDPDKASDKYMNHIQAEVAPQFPDSFSSSKKRVYKNLRSLYLAKGTAPAIKAYFKILYGDDSEIHYPRDNMMILSGGDWDSANNKYGHERNLLGYSFSKVQDSKYYQRFSYVIKTGSSFSTWGGNVKKLMHPAGFALFGEVLLTNKVQSQTNALGWDETKENFYWVQAPDVSNTSQVASTTLGYNVLSEASGGLGTWYNLEKLKFLLGNPIQEFGHIRLSDININNGTVVQPGVEIDNT